MNYLVPIEEESLPVEYRGMLQRIKQTMPEIYGAAANFHKSASQFKQAVLDITPLTPIRSSRQVLAEITRTRQALEEAHFGMARARVKIARAEAQLAKEQDELERELLQIEIGELRCQNANSDDSVKGAIRKMSYLVGVFRAMSAEFRKKHGRDYTEEDFEREEVKYHIMTALKQGWIAANSRGGQIDEGNLIYCFDLGLPLAAVRKQILDRYNAEQEMLKRDNPQFFPHSETIAWLEQLAEHFKDCPRQFAEARGFKLVDVLSLASANAEAR